MLLLTWEWKVQAASSFIWPTGHPQSSILSSACALNDQMPSGAFYSSPKMNWPDVAQLMPHARQKTLSGGALSPVDINVFEVFLKQAFPQEHQATGSANRNPFISLTNRWCPVVSKYHFISIQLNRWIRTGVPVGKCSLTGQLSTCNVALPPFLVNRTKWYLPSFIGVDVSFTLMSTVPMLNVTHTFPCS